MSDLLINKIIAFDLVRYTRSPLTIVALAFAALFFALILMLLSKNDAYIYLGVTSSLDALAQNQNAHNAEAMHWNLQVKKFLGNAIPELLRTTPLLGCFYIFIMWVTPFFCMLLTSNQLASDLRSKHLRFLLQRVSRNQLLIARFLSAWLLWMIFISVFIVLALFIFSFSGVKIPFDKNIFVALRMLITLTVYAAPFILLMTFFNTFISNAFLVFISGIGALFLFSTIQGILIEKIAVVEYLSPTRLGVELFSNNIGDLMLTLGGLLIYSALYAAAAIYIFNKKDV